ncbi:MAG: multifunctional CCA addition/repair protein [Gammaproteobacteria bacterium]|nr:multifunctional CCA addition/repair protein [Gammaproteobacteria bacterium]
MQIYLVGGAVRDRLLGIEAGERDWVVVGARPDELESRGYRRVGASFPVFLHPETGEEYALARTERKTGPGYHGFEIQAAPDVTLEDDLRRRDLTINAMAQDDKGAVIDPWGGRRDLAAKLLRHVSDAFREDPVRILRVARFAARYAPLGFAVADETLAVMREMVVSGEAASLVPERVWQETEKALAEPRPDVFLRVLRNCGALAIIFPEVDALWGVPQPARWHPEIDTGEHLLLALQESARLGATTPARFAVLVHDLGKGTTPPAEWPKHIAHEERSVALVEQLCGRLGAPARYRELGVIVARHHGNFGRALEMRPATILRLLEDTDALRRPERFDEFLAACEADARGRLGFSDRPCPQAALLRAALDAAREVTAADPVARGLEGPAVGEALRELRIAAIKRVRDAWAGTPADI